jgi:predicted N-acetyltransferase YhbS
VARADSHGTLVGSIRYWPVAIGPRQSPALLLGPLAVEPLLAGQGIGRALIGQSLDMAAWARHRAVLLVGDESYSGRVGFRPVATHGIVMPGENPARLLGLELVPGALAQTTGTLQPGRSLRRGARRLKAA